MGLIVLLGVLVLGLTYIVIGVGHLVGYMGDQLGNVWRNVQAVERQRKIRIATFAAAHPEWRPRRHDWYEG